MNLDKFSNVKVNSFGLAYGAQLFKALGDSSRLRILHLLYQMPELSISDMEVILEFTQTKVARLMMLLKHAGLVQSRRQDYWVLYQVHEGASGLIGIVMELIHKDPILVSDLAACKNMASNRELSIIKLAGKLYNPGQSEWN